ncbi:MAG: DUF3987 domain-containing protein [Planctomycetes bacterium]|nr:DUF3987 domain-containing protein [Planctomycetota bacterium]
MNTLLAPGEDGHRPILTPEDFVQALEARGSEVRRTPKGYRAGCPCHDDRNPSLDIDSGRGGRVLVKCRACSAGFVEVATELGLLRSSSARTALARPLKPPRTMRAAPLENRERSSTFATLEAARRAAMPKGAGWTLAKEYRYLRVDGSEAQRVLRFERFDEAGKRIGKSFRPTSPNGERWSMNAAPAPRPLYNLPDLVAHRERIVFLVEGEKAADGLAELFLEAQAELCAATWSGGTGGVAGADFGPLAGRFVALWPDNDEPGRKAMHAVEQRLASLDSGASVLRLEVLGLPEKGDAADWIAMRREAGKSARELVHELDGLVRRGAWRDLSAWPELRPFDALPHELAGVPMELLRETVPVLGELVEAISRGCSVDPVMPLAAALGFASFATARLLEQIECGPISTVPVLWCGIIAGPSERKSTVLRHVTRVNMALLDAELGAATAARKAAGEAADARKEVARSRRAGRASVSADSKSSSAVLEVQEEPLPPLPFALLGGDSTPEAVVQRLEDADGLGFLEAEEGKFLDLVGGHYSGRADISALNSAWDGGRVSVARASGDRREIVVPCAKLAIVLAVQPSVVGDVAGKRTQEGGGFFARWLFFVPEERAGSRRVPATLAEAKSSRTETPPAWAQRMQELFLCASEAPPRGALSIEGEETFQRFRVLDELAEAAQRRGSGLEHLRDWFGKLPTQVVRIVAELHLLRHGPGGLELAIEPATMHLATEIGALAAIHAIHARRIIGGRAGASQAELVLRWAIGRGEPFAVRDLQQARPKWSAEELRVFVEELTARGYLREFTPAQGSTGRPPGKRYMLCPELHSGPKRPRASPLEALRALVRGEKPQQSQQNSVAEASRAGVPLVLLNESAPTSADRADLRQDDRNPAAVRTDATSGAQSRAERLDRLRARIGSAEHGAGGVA